MDDFQTQDGAVAPSDGATDVMVRQGGPQAGDGQLPYPQRPQQPYQQARQPQQPQQLYQPQQQPYPQHQPYPQQPYPQQQYPVAQPSSDGWLKAFKVCLTVLGITLAVWLVAGVALGVIGWLTQDSGGEIGAPAVIAAIISWLAGVVFAIDAPAIIVTFIGMLATRNSAQRPAQPAQAPYPQQPYRQQQQPMQQQFQQQPQQQPYQVPAQDGSQPQRPSE